MSETNKKMRSPRKTQPEAAPTLDGLAAFLPEGLGDLTDVQRALPRIAKDERLTILTASKVCAHRICSESGILGRVLRLG